MLISLVILSPAAAAAGGGGGGGGGVLLLPACRLLLSLGKHGRAGQDSAL